MKAKLYNILFLLLIPAFALAGELPGRYKKEKRISKTYIVNSNAALDVTNQYGNIYVTTWDENKTAIEIVIKASADRESLLDERINSINIDIEATKALIKSMTKIGNFRGKANMEINYTIKIPKNGAVRVTNQYGGIMLGKIFAKAEVNIQYGDLTVEELHNDNNIINAEYSNNSKIGYLKNGILSVRHSGYTFTKVNNLTTNSEYTNLKIGNIDKLMYKSDYGNLEVANVDQITGSSEYMPTKIGRVNELLNITTRYGNLQVGVITKNVKNIGINAAYSNIDLKYALDNAFDFEIYTEYGRFDGGSNLRFQEKRQKQFQAYYRGYHKSSGVNRLFIKSEYGNIEVKQL